MEGRDRPAAGGAAHPQIRRACADDAQALASLIDLSNGGGDRGDMERAVKNVLVPGSDVGWGNAIVAESGGLIIAAMIVNLLSEDRLPPPGDVDPVHRPFERLKRLVPDSLYLRNIAVLPECRGLGIGGILVAAAADMARLCGAPAVSAIVLAGNAPMERLLQRSGFSASASDALQGHAAYADGSRIRLWIRTS